MEYRKVGRSGLVVSVLAVGGNNLGRSVDVDGTKRIVDAAFDLGINLFDTSNNYNQGKSEDHLGRALEGRRAKAIVATKVATRVGPGPNDRGLSRAHILDSVDNSLRRLRTDYIDLLQAHVWDDESPIDETLRAFDDLVRQGKTRYLGCSNFAAWQLMWSLWTSDRLGLNPFISVQPEYSLVSREIEDELLPACRATGIGVLPYFPLAGGLLTGKYREHEAPQAGTRGDTNEYFKQNFMTPRNFAIVRRVEPWARDHGHTPAELAVAWLLAEPTVSSVITGATKPEQLAENTLGVTWKLTADEVAQVSTLASGEP